jgi:hypothetical protein
MEEIRRELVLKLEDLSGFVEKHAKGLLVPAEAARAEELCQQKFKSEEEKSLVDRMNVLTVMPDWLESLRRSLLEFTEVARSLKPVHEGKFLTTIQKF